VTDQGGALPAWVGNPVEFYLLLHCFLLPVGAGNEDPDAHGVLRALKSAFTVKWGKLQWVCGKPSGTWGALTKSRHFLKFKCHMSAQQQGELKFLRCPNNTGI
jgi:hypothetical protein